jgi:hypothetical protein
MKPTTTAGVPTSRDATRQTPDIHVLGSNTTKGLWGYRQINLSRAKRGSKRNEQSRCRDRDLPVIGSLALKALRDLWPITIRIVSVITTMRSAVLSCFHETFCVDGKLDRGTPSQSGGVAPLFCGALAPSRRYARWGRPYFQQFFGAMPRRIRPHCRRSLFEPRGIEDPVELKIIDVLYL